MKRQSPFIVFVLLTLLTACATAQEPVQSSGIVSSYKECIAAGNPMLKSYPAKCVTKDGKVFVDEMAKPRKSPAAACENHCGDSICAEVVCMGTGCPCAENKDNCEADCK